MIVYFPPIIVYFSQDRMMQNAKSVVNRKFEDNLIFLCKLKIERQLPNLVTITSYGI